ncbi:MAG: S1 family peptidase, partial [Bdellovibrionota bacterium]
PVAKSTVGIFSPSPDHHSGSLCTGTIIRNNIAVTAAHCIPAGDTKPIVVFNPDMHAPNPNVHPAQEVMVNPKWGSHAGKGMDQGDIALVKFGGGLPKGYKKVSSVGTDSEIKSGANVILAGYGIDNARTKTGAGRLRKTAVQITNSRTGKSEMILDQSHGHGACHGDSGGPAYVTRNGKMILAGVTNRSYPSRAPDDCGHKVVYTKVPAYRSWIQKSEKRLETSNGNESRVMSVKKTIRNGRQKKHRYISARRPAKKTHRMASRQSHRKSTRRS